MCKDTYKHSSVTELSHGLIVFTNTGFGDSKLCKRHRKWKKKKISPSQTTLPLSPNLTHPEHQWAQASLWTHAAAAAVWFQDFKIKFVYWNKVKWNKTKWNETKTNNTLGIYIKIRIQKLTFLIPADWHLRLQKRSLITLRLVCENLIQIKIRWLACIYYSNIRGCAICVLNYICYMFGVCLKIASEQWFS